MTTEKKKYTVVCYMRIDAEDIELMTYDQAKVEIEQSKLMQPDNIYRIEKVEIETNDEDEFNKLKFIKGVFNDPDPEDVMP